MEIDKETLINIIKECVSELVWRWEQCFVIFSDEDMEIIDKIIQKHMEE